MPDPLYESIERAIGQSLDARLFERCAVDLLRQGYYSGLRGTPPNHDVGIDGISGSDSEPEFILVVTTARDFARNLRESVEHYVRAESSCRAVVLATSREVSIDRRRKLDEELSQKWGVRLWAVHDRDEFVRLLYDNPRWRKELLDIAGAARALSRFPAFRGPAPALSLIGRDDDLERLQRTTGDVVLVGRPGVGKTFLLAQLAAESWCLFDAGRSAGDLPDAIREMRPERIVIDDAHLAGENRIPDLRRLRKEMVADFGIVAVTWPGQVSAVSTLLGNPIRVDVEELDREQILSIIEEAGVEGPVELQRRLVDQARGCAGLAVMLAWSCVAGGVQAAASGDVLLAHLARWYERTLGSDSRDTLGALALAGDHGATLAQVRSILDITRPRASALIRGLASGGTIDEVPAEREQRMRVQPELLRYALVRDVFFGADGGAFDVWDAVNRLDHPSIAALPLIGAIHRDARVDRAQLLDLVDWSDEWTTTEYACLGPTEFRTAIERAPRHRTSIAGTAYRAGIDQKRALETLMEDAIGDRRAEHSTPEHPLRIVAGFLHGLETGLPPRQFAMKTALEWLDQGRDAEVGVRVLMHAIHPGMRGSSTDPGRGDTLTISESAVPLSWVEHLGLMWDEILDFVEHHPDLPPAPFLGGLSTWMFPDGQIGFGRGLSEETVEALRGVASHVLARLSRIHAARPGVLRKLDAGAQQARLSVEIDVPDAFSALFPKHWGAEKNGDYKDWERNTNEAVALLAEGFRERSNKEIAALIVEAEAEAAAAGITYPRKTPVFARILAGDVEVPEGLLEALTEREAPSDIILPFLDRAVALRRPGWEALLERHLDEADTCLLAVHVALKHPCEDHLKRRAVERAAAHLDGVQSLIFHNEVDLATLALLLEAPDVPLQRQAAVTLMAWTAGRFATLPPSMQARCREIIVASPGDDMMFPSMLKSDPELCADWLRAWFHRLREPAQYEYLRDYLEEAVAAMPTALRRSLIADVPADVYRSSLKDAVQQLVSDDLDVAVALFERSDIEHLHDAALRGGPSESWMERALLALDHGWEPERIAVSTRPLSLSWSGDLSDVWRGKIEDCKRLRVGAGPVADERRERIISAGVAYFERLRDEEATQERRARIYGRDSR